MIQVSVDITTYLLPILLAMGTVEKDWAVYTAHKTGFSVSPDCLLAYMIVCTNLVALVVNALLYFYFFLIGLLKAGI